MSGSLSCVYADSQSAVLLRKSLGLTDAIPMRFRTVATLWRPIPSILAMSVSGMPTSLPETKPTSSILSIISLDVLTPQHCLRRGTSLAPMPSLSARRWFVLAKSRMRKAQEFPPTTTANFPSFLTHEKCGFMPNL